jgi:hypothetical protein
MDTTVIGSVLKRLSFKTAILSPGFRAKRRAFKSWLWLATLTAAGSLSSAELYESDQPNAVVFEPVEARFIRLAILDCSQGEPCLDELEVYGPSGDGNLALASAGAKATTSSSIAGYDIHRVEHLNDGRYGNSHSWIAAGTRNEWAQIELPKTMTAAKVVFSRDRNGQFHDRMPGRIEIRVSTDGASWKTVAHSSGHPQLPDGSLSEADFLHYAFECENLTWQKIDPSDPLSRVLGQLGQMIERFSARGIDVWRERAELEDLRRRAGASALATHKDDLFFAARLAKRRLFLRDPELSPLTHILFVKRHPYEPSHNYSVILDAAGAPGGGIYRLETPVLNGRLEPVQAKVTLLFDAGKGIARDPATSLDASRIYFGHRNSKSDFFHLWSMNADGGEAKRITDGPFHDFFPCPLPDGGLAFISTRCKARFLCWRPQAFVLFRMAENGTQIQPLSHANLSEWTPSLMNDGRIIWMRSEYLDKGADFGHTLWAIHPDGTHPELVFGNDTLNCYAGGREVPGTREIVCTLVSHGGDLNGPIALIDVDKGRFNPLAISNITPDVQPHYHMSWANKQCFRDPVPISQNYFLCSHAPYDKFGIYAIDRHGNRELLYLDPEIGSMAPTLFKPSTPAPVLPATVEPEQNHQSQFVVADVYRGLEPAVARGRVKYIRVCQELRADLEQLPDGSYQRDHEAFQDWYASPTHKVTGPNGWPSYVAKGNLGIAPVEEDGSASFQAPAGKVLYFQLLDGDLNELQRMRSVVQLQEGETRGCIGCHEHRMSAPPGMHSQPLAMRRAPSKLDPPPWGAGAFSYEQVVQPVWDAQCVRCHDSRAAKRQNLAGTLDAEGVPASYRTLIENGWVHYFDNTWGQEHNKAAPLTFGTLKSKLWRTLDEGHHDVRLTREEMHRVKCWIDLNCPLWPDYMLRENRLKLHAANLQK